MGMGEPLANYDATLLALTIVNAEWGLGFGARRITLSTSGLVPKIRQARRRAPRLPPRHQPPRRHRRGPRKIMPVNKAWPSRNSCPPSKEFSEKHGRMVTLEFILIEDVNDSIDQAGEAPRHRPRPARAREPHPLQHRRRPALEAPLSRARRNSPTCSTAARVSVTLRREKGHDIDAACGQLRLKTEKAREAAAAS
jgi:23S rRNA (adenine2503-C2)-methyltransferase